MGILSEIYTLRRAIDSINKRCFDGQQSLFPPVAEGFDKLQTSLEELVDIYNDDLADSIERAERLLKEAGKGSQKSAPPFDLAGSVETVQEPAHQLAFMVDMAKADALRRN